MAPKHQVAMKLKLDPVKFRSAFICLDKSLGLRTTFRALLMLA